MTTETITYSHYKTLVCLCIVQDVLYANWNYITATACVKLLSMVIELVIILGTLLLKVFPSTQWVATMQLTNYRKPTLYSIWMA